MNFKKYFFQVNISLIRAFLFNFHKFTYIKEIFIHFLMIEFYFTELRSIFIQNLLCPFRCRAWDKEICNKFHLIRYRNLYLLKLTV